MKKARLIFEKPKTGFLAVNGLIGLFCSNCGARREEGYRDYCYRCGARLAHPSCSKCGRLIAVSCGVRTDNWEDNEHCRNCGAKLPIMSDFLVSCKSKEGKE